MAVRKAIVREINGDGSTGRVLGQLIDDGSGTPYGTTASTDSMLRADPQDRFERYYQGYSNGYTFETVPDIALAHPAEWQAYLRRLADGQGESFDQFAASIR